MRMTAPVLAVGLAACAPRALRYAAPDLASRLPSSVAVLPFDNESVSLKGPSVLRALATEALAARGFSQPEVSDVDAGLGRLGVTDGGQMRALDPKKVGEAVGATAMKICAELAVRGKLRRARALSGRLPRVWCYYNVSDSDYGNNGLGGRARDGD